MWPIRLQNGAYGLVLDHLIAIARFFVTGLVYIHLLMILAQYVWLISPVYKARIKLMLCIHVMHLLIGMLKLQVQEYRRSECWLCVVGDHWRNFQCFANVTTFL